MEHEQYRYPTDVREALPGGVALFVVAVLYGLILEPIRGTFVGEVLWQSSYVGVIICVLTVWSLVILLQKARALIRLRKVMEAELLPNRIADSIDRASAVRFALYLTHLPFPWHPVVRRLQTAARQHANGLPASDVMQQLNTAAYADHTSVDEGYALLKSFTWALPILGFIGTVIGIGSSIGGFSGSLAGAEDVTMIKGALGDVVSGLALAFYTTLMGLVASMIIVFPTSLLQKEEHHFLARTEDYCQRHFLSRLVTGARTNPPELSPAS